MVWQHCYWQDMVPSTTIGSTRAKKPIGLRYWMLQVPEECDRDAADFGADPDHDLRASLRRRRSLADGLIALDPDPNWKAMKKAGKRLFQRLGALLDTQVMMEWVEKLERMPPAVDADNSSILSQAESKAEPPQNPVGRLLLETLRGREKEQKLDGQAAL